MHPSNPFLFPITVFGQSAVPAPPTPPPLTFCQRTMRLLASLCPKLALQKFIKATDTVSCPGFVVALPPCRHVIFASSPGSKCRNPHVQQNKEIVQHKSHCKNTEISSLRIRVRGFAFSFCFFVFFSFEQAIKTRLSPSAPNTNDAPRDTAAALAARLRLDMQCERCFSSCRSTAANAAPPPLHLSHQDTSQRAKASCFCCTYTPPAPNN